MKSFEEIRHCRPLPNGGLDILPIPTTLSPAVHATPDDLTQSCKGTEYGVVGQYRHVMATRPHGMYAAGARLDEAEWN